MSEMSGMFAGLRISASGMRAQRVRQNIITSNLANAETTRTPEGGPYKKEFAVFKAHGPVSNTLVENRTKLAGTTTNGKHMQIRDSKSSLKRLKNGMGVEIAEIRKDSRPPKLVHNPAHPDADENGNVAMPNISVVEEMADMISASRAYEANVTAFNATKSMLLEALKL